MKILKTYNLILTEVEFNDLYEHLHDIEEHYLPEAPIVQLYNRIKELKTGAKL